MKKSELKSLIQEVIKEDTNPKTIGPLWREIGRNLEGIKTIFEEVNGNHNLIVDKLKKKSLTFSQVNEIMFYSRELYTYLK